MTFIREFVALVATAIFTLSVMASTAKSMDLDYLSMSLHQLTMVRF